MVKYVYVFVIAAVVYICLNYIFGSRRMDIFCKGGVCVERYYRSKGVYRLELSQDGGSDDVESYADFSNAAYIDIIWNVKDGNIVLSSDGSVSVHNESGEIGFRDFDNKPELYDRLFLHTEGDYSVYNDGVEFVSVSVTDGFSRDENGVIE